MYPVGNYMFKFNNRNTRTRCEICSKITKTPERRQWHHSGFFIVNFEHNLQLRLVFLLLTLSSYMPAGYDRVFFVKIVEVTHREKARSKK